MQFLIDQIISSFEAQASVQATPLSNLQKNGAQQICLLNPVNIFGRTQPVSVELAVSNTNSKVYILSLKTPMGTKIHLTALIDRYPIFQFPYEQEYFTVKMCLDTDADDNDINKIYMRVDIPLITEIGTDNSLSQYEINEALKDLVEGADLIERLAISGQDINFEEMENNTKTIPYNDKNKLRADLYKEKLNQSWQFAFNRKYIFLDHTINDLAPAFALQWKLNHDFPFVKFITLNQSLELTLAYYSEDIQQKEQNVLESFFINTLKKISTSTKLRKEIEKLGDLTRYMSNNAS